MLRGGSWGYDPLILLSSDRLYNAPFTRDMYWGFWWGREAFVASQVQ